MRLPIQACHRSLVDSLDCGRPSPTPPFEFSGWWRPSAFFRRFFPAFMPLCGGFSVPHGSVYEGMPVIALTVASGFVVYPQGRQDEQRGGASADDVAGTRNPDFTPHGSRRPAEVIDESSQLDARTYYSLAKRRGPDEIIITLGSVTGDTSLHPSLLLDRSSRVPLCPEPVFI